MEKTCDIQRCNNNCKNNMKFFNKVVTSNIKDNNSLISIGVFFHIVDSKFNKKDIYKNIDYAINTINRDFNGNPINRNYGIQIVNHLPNSGPNPYVKQMYNNTFNRFGTSNIKFTCTGYRTYNITDGNFAQHFGIDSVPGIEKFILNRAKPVQQARYLNIWVVKMKHLLGFSYFPWMKKNYNHVNGIVLNRVTFDRKQQIPSYNLCKTLTHELGHFFGLLHTFSNPNLKPQSNDKYKLGNAVIDYNKSTNQDVVGDCVVDTFPQNNPTFGNPINNTRYLGRLLTNNNNNIYMANFTNYMDYTNDACMFSFTKDQVNKMRLFVFKFRPNIVARPVNRHFNYKNKL